MEYWEFLLQKEGDRSWLPIKSANLEIEAGRYRVVAHSARTNTDVEICVTHESTKEVPPKRRSQKRSRRTNPDGLMVVIPFTHLKPGRWELRCCGDVMSDFLGKPWQHAVQLQVLPKAADVLQASEPASPQVDATEQVDATQKDVQADLSENFPSISNPDLAVEPPPTQIEAPPLAPVAAEAAVPGDRDWGLGIGDWVQSEGESGRVEEWEKFTPSSEPSQSLVPLKPAELDEIPVAFTSNSASVATPANPILAESLQRLEQILQQVLEPVLQEFNRAEAQEAETAVTPEPELSLETGANWQGLTLTLDEESLEARRGESLSITGQVDVLDINSLNGSGTSRDLNEIFQGRLRYELRDPQSSQVLLDVQQPLSEQALPLAFRHTLEIPSDCKTRLILGKVTLYGANSAALASQPFTITADLDELLGAIIPGSKVMPVAKMLVLANNLAASPENEALQEVLPPLNQALLDLVDNPKSRQPLPLQPAPQQPLPPQLYQPTPTPKGSKFLDLPNFSKVQPVTTAESSAVVSAPDRVEVKQEDSVEQPVAFGNGFSSESLNPLVSDTEARHQSEEETSKGNTVPVADSSSSALVAIALSESPPTVEDAIPDSSDALETPEPSESTTDSQLDTSDAIDTLVTVTPSADFLGSEWDEIEPEQEAAEVPPANPVDNESDGVDNAFQALNVQDRFWSRLNSIATDTELSEWLKFELALSSPPTPPIKVEDIPEQQNPDHQLADVEDVTEQQSSEKLLADFDESIWEEETDEFGNAIADITELQPPPLEQPPMSSVTNRDWAAQEIVVEDEELPAAEQPVVKQDASGMVYLAEPPSPQPQPEIDPVQLESLLPAPRIFIPTNELTAGEPVTVRIKVPPSPSRLYIKLWVQDRQSRSLLDGPRWLVDFLPDGSGDLEALTQLIVPLGSVEIRFEAIAVDIYTQRESHKVTVDCVVIPPDLPSLSLDEFEA